MKISSVPQFNASAKYDLDALASVYARAINKVEEEQGVAADDAKEYGKNDEEVPASVSLPHT